MIARTTRYAQVFLALCGMAASTTGYAFSPATRPPLAMSTTVAPSETDRRTARRTREREEPRRRRFIDEEDDSYDPDNFRRDGPLEYLMDDSEARELDDPFHILLLGATFEKPKITVSYVSGSLTYVLDMPELEAQELSTFARLNGMSCLGTWSRRESLELGRQLQVRDIVCRVVPFTEGGHRGWQAKEGSGFVDVPSML